MKLIVVYTGNGEGKTSAAFGHVLRALGQGKKCAVIKFLKPRKSGEDVIEKLSEGKAKIYNFGRKGFVAKPAEKDKELAKKALKKAEEIVKREKPFLLVLDEINVAMSLGLLKEDEVIEFLKNVKKGIIILTGRGRNKKIEKLANIVTEFREIKHDFPKRKATKGFEY